MVGMWMFSVWSFQLYCVFEIFHNKVRENWKVLIIYCGVKEFGLYYGVRELMNDFKRSYKIGILEENEIQGMEC